MVGEIGLKLYNPAVLYNPPQKLAILYFLLSKARHGRQGLLEGSGCGGGRGVSDRQEGKAGKVGREGNMGVKR